jgi:hypothetical protein
MLLFGYRLRHNHIIVMRQRQGIIVKKFDIIDTFEILENAWHLCYTSLYNKKGVVPH